MSPWAPGTSLTNGHKALRAWTVSHDPLPPGKDTTRGGPVPARWPAAHRRRTLIRSAARGPGACRSRDSSADGRRSVPDGLWPSGPDPAPGWSAAGRRRRSACGPLRGSTAPLGLERGRRRRRGWPCRPASGGSQGGCLGEGSVDYAPGAPLVGASEDSGAGVSHGSRASRRGRRRPAGACPRGAARRSWGRRSSHAWPCRRGWPL